MRLVHTTKPTGHSTQPFNVTWALRIYNMIQRKAAIDEANVQSDGGSDNDGDENAPPAGELARSAQSRDAECGKEAFSH